MKTESTNHGISQKNYDRAWCLVRSYKKHVDRGMVVEAEQERRTIELLVGFYEDGQVRLPREMALAMGRRDLAGKPVAS